MKSSCINWNLQRKIALGVHLCKLCFSFRYKAKAQSVPPINSFRAGVRKAPSIRQDPSLIRGLTAYSPKHPVQHWKDQTHIMFKCNSNFCLFTEYFKYCWRFPNAALQRKSSYIQGMTKNIRKICLSKVWSGI